MYNSIDCLSDNCYSAECDNAVFLNIELYSAEYHYALNDPVECNSAKIHGATTPVACTISVCERNLQL